MAMRSPFFRNQLIEVAIEDTKCCADVLLNDHLVNIEEIIYNDEMILMMKLHLLIQNGGVFSFVQQK